MRSFHAHLDGVKEFVCLRPERRRPDLRSVFVQEVERKNLALALDVCPPEEWNQKHEVEYGE